MAELTYKLVAFDVDGTLIGNRDGKVVWQLLNNHFARDETANARRYEAYMTGQITYAEWVDLDVGQWVEVGATRTEIVGVIQQHLFLVPGARETVEALRQRGYKLAVISGTLDLTLALLFSEHPFEEIFTNKIWFDDQGLIAGWEATPYDMSGKAEALAEIASRQQVTLEQTVYVGDNINDIQVMEAAGLAVAFEPKHPSVIEAADEVVRGDLRGLIPLLDGP